MREYFTNRAPYALSQMYSYLGIEPTKDEYTIADLVLLQKYLLGTGELENWEKYDLFNDNVIDVFDMCLLRKAVIDSINSKPNMMVNSNGLSYYFDTSDNASGSISTVSDFGFSADVKSSGTQPWSVQAKYKGLKIEKGAVYQISFDYTASDNIEAGANIMEASDDYTNYFYMALNFTPEVQHFCQIFTMNENTDSSARLSFDLGALENTPYSVTVTNIRLVRIA